MARHRRGARRGGTALFGQVPLDLPVLSEPEEEPKPRLSLIRVLVAICVLGGAAYGGYLGVKVKIASAGALHASTWFAPYVDVTLTPTDEFQVPANDPARQTVLGFVVAASSTSCTPSWGGAYNLAQANESLALGARLAQLEANGASPVVSFGGEKNTSLAVACPTPVALAKAYEAVISAYDLHTIDLDVEGPALDNFAADLRLAAALPLVEQDEVSAHRRPPAVWLTVPVEPSGLQGNAISVLSSMLRDRVRLAGINVMAMDFAQPPSTGQTMLGLAELALQSTHRQLSRLLPSYGIRLKSATVWRHIGVTVMIGQNTVSGENFTLRDATGLRSFVRAKGIARVSIWSLNRDQACGDGGGTVAILSDTCSGTRQSQLAFTNLFDHFGGSLPKVSDSSDTLLRSVSPDTNPANAPYPLWNPTASYVADYKVVEDGEIYQAKWYNSAQDPATQYQYSWQSPWELLGPVLPTDHAPVIPTLPPGTHPAWSPGQMYVAGRDVLYEGLPYEAKWTNQGVPPGITSTEQPSSPWQPLSTIPGEPSTAG